MSKANRTMRRASGIVASGGLGALIVEHGIGGTFYALFEIIIAGMYSFGDALLAPFRSLYTGVSQFVEITILSGLRIIEAGANNAARSITTGYWAQLGPLTYALGIASFIAGLAIVVWFLRRTEWRPWHVLTGIR